MRHRVPAFGIVGQPPTGARIEASGIAVRRGQRLGDFGTRTKAGVDELLLFQLVQRFAVERRPLGLDDRIAIMIEAEPFQVLENAVDKLRPAAAGVQILDAQQEPAAAVPGTGVAQRSRIGMAEVQTPGRRGGETCDLQDSLHAKATSATLDGDSPDVVSCHRHPGLASGVADGKTGLEPPVSRQGSVRPGKPAGWCD